jgi:outer membrane protein TolC
LGRAGEQTVSLEDVVKAALSRNPGLASSAQDFAASRARVTQALSAYQPQVSSQAGYQRLWYSNLLQAIAAGGTQNSFNEYSAGVSVTQYIYDFGRTAGKVESTRKLSAASGHDLAKTTADVVRDVKRAYYEVLKNVQLLMVSDESIRTSKAHLDQARGFYKVGLRPKIDVTKAEVEVAQAELSRIQADYTQRLSVVSLEQILGGPPVEGPYKLADVAESSPWVPTPACGAKEDRVPEAGGREEGNPPACVPGPEIQDSRAISELVREALSNRPEVAELFARIQSGEADLSAAQAAYWPSIAAAGNYAWENVDLSRYSEWNFGGQLSWNLYTGSMVSGKIAEVKAALASLKAQAEQLRLSVESEVSTAYLEVSEAREAIRTAGLGLVQAQENMDLAQGRYRAGVGDAIEYSDAELTLTQARNNLVTATYDLFQFQADLDHALGKKI